MPKLRIAKSEEGMMLLQVVLVSTVLLALLYTGFRTVRSTIQAANSTATSASFQDLLLLFRQNLAVTETCLAQLGGSPVSSIVNLLINNPNFAYPITVRWPNGELLSQVETVQNATGRESPEFKITELSIRNTRRLGRSILDTQSSNGRQTTERFQAQLTLVAERRNEFLGSREMRGTIDVFFLLDPATRQFTGCTTRTNYQVPLGPPNLLVRKSGLECIDRGGTPVVRAGTDWYICRIPLSALMNCESINNSVRGPNTHPEGWICDASISSPQAAYAY